MGEPRPGSETSSATRLHDAVGFDLDGTLFDHRGAALAAFDELLGTLGRAPSAAAQAAWLSAEETHFERWRSGEISFSEQRRERQRCALPGFAWVC